MEALTEGGEGTLQTAALEILRAIFEAPNLDLGPPAHVLSDPQLFYPVAALLETHRSGQALQASLSEFCCILKLQHLWGKPAIPTHLAHS